AGLSLRVELLVWKGTRLQIKSSPDPAVAPCPDGRRRDGCSVWQWTIVSPGWLWRITRGVQVVDTWLDLSLLIRAQDEWAGQCMVDGRLPPSQLDIADFADISKAGTVVRKTAIELARNFGFLPTGPRRPDSGSTCPDGQRRGGLEDYYGIG